MGFFALSILILSSYAWTIGKWINRWRKALKVNDGAASISADSGLTVIVPSRDEASRLPLLLADLKNQSLSVRVLVVDDQSEDDTMAQASALGVEVIPSEGVGKKAAIITGMKVIKTPWVATLDADVRVGHDWAKSMVQAAADQSAQAVVGSVRLTPHAPGWQRFQALEYGCMMVWIGGGISKGTLAMGSGANLLFSHAHYPIDELQTHWASGDDSFALEALREAGHSIVWNGDQAARADTATAPDWPTLWMQRARWASKAQGYENEESRNIAGLVAAVSLVLLAWIVASALLLNLRVIGATCLLWMIKTLVDGALLSTTSRAFKISLNLRDIVLFPIRYLILVMGSWMKMIAGKLVWKGRRI